MNAERLLALFDRVSEAPDAVPKLRRFVLDLAVRGKLVEQDPADDPAEELLKRNAEAKSRLMGLSSGKQRGSDAVQLTGCKERCVPTGWALSTLGEIAHKITDGTHKTPTYVSSGIPFVSVKDFSAGSLSFANTRFITGDEHKFLFKRCDPRRGDILIGRIGTLGRAVIVDTDVEFSLFVSVGLIRFDHSIIAPEFLRTLLNSPFVESEFDRIKIGGGTHTNKLNLGDLHTVALPVPPLSEQRRIVARVDELMALCDQLEAARADRERRRDRLTAAAFADLATPERALGERRPDNFSAVGRLAHLTCRVDQVAPLRQYILDLAVRGQLSRQDSADQSASALLKAIDAEKAQLLAAGLLKKFEKAEPRIPEKWPETPRGWETASLQSLCISVTDGDHLPPPKAESGIPFLVIGNVRSKSINFAGCRYVSATYFDALDPIRRPRTGDILYTLVGSYGIPVVVRDDSPFCVQRHIGILRPSKQVDVGYLALAMESRLVLDQATSCATGIAQKTVPLAGLRRMAIPLPPLAEQHRIVARVDELMALCDQLEASLAAADTANARLLDAILHEALNGPPEAKAA